jgi:hypothetical protein
VSRRRGRHEGLWTVLIPGGKLSRTREVPAQAWTFNDRKRAHRLASNIKGARVSGPRRRGCLWYLGLFLAVSLVLCGLVLIFGSGR